MGAGAAIGAVGGIAQGIMGNNAAKSAASAQAAANQQAIAEQQRQFNIGQQNLKPYMGAGQAALQQYQGLATGQIDPNQIINNDPNFKFQVQQGTQNLDQSAAAKGGLLSGNQLKAVQQYGQGLAANQYQQYMGNLWNLANMGQNSAANQASQGNAFGANIGNQMANAGSARAAGIMGQNNAMANTIGSLGQAAGQYQGFGSPLSGRGMM